MITKCKDCVFYDVTDSQIAGQGTCRIKSPRVLLAPGATALGQLGYNVVSAWPPVKSENGCGEGKKRANGKE